MSRRVANRASGRELRHRCKYCDAAGEPQRFKKQNQLQKHLQKCKNKPRNINWALGHNKLNRASGY